MNFIGIDVGKTYLDIADSANNITIKVKNTEKEYEKILKKFPGQNIVCMEATGIYYLNIAKYLSFKNWIVYVVNPRIIKSYKDSLLSRTKTDKVDSIHISKFISERHSDLHRFVVKSDSLFKLTAESADSLEGIRVAGFKRIWVNERPALILCNEFGEYVSSDLKLL